MSTRVSSIMMGLVVVGVLLSGCATTGGAPRVAECKKYVGIGALAGGLVGATLGAKVAGGDSTSTKERVAAGVVGGVSGGVVGYAICAAVWRQKQALEQGLRALDQPAGPVLVDASPSSADSDGTQETGNAVQGIQVLDDRAIRLDLNSSFLFPSGKKELQKNPNDYLDVVAESLNEYGQSDVIVIGHTDDVGSEASNQLLSHERARTVTAYMEGRGVDPARIQTVGKGESEPVGSNTTDEGRASNRRVEIVITHRG